MKKKIRKILIKVMVISLPLLLLIIIVLSTITAINGQQGDSTSDIGNADVSAAVLAWKPDVEKYAQQYGLSQYVNLILAIIQQESGGTSIDVMQSSEGSFNTQYPHIPNGITDPVYSIQCGIQELKQDLTKAGVKDINDTNDLDIALQSYNFGDGFISYAKSHGGYSKAVAQAFANMEGGHYGDVDYVDHVLKYYSLSAVNASGSGKLDSVITIAQQQEGKAYVWGASGPDTFDCSGFVYFCYKSAGINVDRTTAQGYYDESTKVSNPQIGDLVFFGSIGAIEHIGIYIGNNQMIDAPHTGTVVKIQNVNESNFEGYGHLNK